MVLCIDVKITCYMFYGLMTTDLFYLYCDISFLFKDMEQSIFIAKKCIHEMYKTIHNNVNKVTLHIESCQKHPL